jgi:hypothetical protein
MFYLIYLYVGAEESQKNEDWINVEGSSTSFLNTMETVLGYKRIASFK